MYVICVIYCCVVCFFLFCFFVGPTSFGFLVENPAATAVLFLSEGGCGAGDLWPRGRLISAVTRPDVQLAVSLSQPIPLAHTHTHLHTYSLTHSYACIETRLRPPGLF